MKATAQQTALARLIAALETATGADHDLDRRIHRLLETAERGDTPADAVPAYTGSVPDAIRLVERILPGWTWHLGYGVRGIFPYAALARGGARRCQSSAPSVPLALSLATLRAFQAEGEHATARPKAEQKAAPQKRRSKSRG